MQTFVTEEIVKIQAKGLLTIPKGFRLNLGLEENTLARLKEEKGRLVIEPVRTLPYPVRRYTDKEIDDFLVLDTKETKELKKKGLL
jgi:bifunctional DNA-binding transcriptional regulator/antitoxin component of YhaV-PrlF toxin-antitoxin module